MIDYPEADGTDAAHPAWWRGHDHTVDTMCQLIRLILDGEKDATGIANEPWESTKRRLMGLVAENEQLRKEVTMWRREYEDLYESEYEA